MLSAGRGMANLEELLIRIDATTEGLRRELKRADQSVNQTTSTIEAAGKRTEASFKRVGVAATTYFSVRAIENFSAEVVRTSMRFDALNASMLAASGSAQDYQKNMEHLRSESDRLGLVVLDSGKAFARLTAAAKGTALEGDAVREIFTGISEAATVLRFNTEDTEGAIRALEQMLSKGKVSMEELRLQLGDRLPGAFKLAAQAMGKDPLSFEKMVADGKVLAEDFLPKLIKTIREEYASGVAEASKSAQANVNRLTNAINDSSDAMGTAITQSELYKDSVSGLAIVFENLAHIINTATGNFENFNNAQINSTLENTINSIERVQDRLNKLRSGDGFFITTEAREEAIKRELGFLDEYKQRYSQLMDLIALKSQSAIPLLEGNKPKNNTNTPENNTNTENLKKYREELELTVEQLDELNRLNMISTEVYEERKREIEAENEARQKGLKIGTQEYADTVRLIKQRETLKETIDETTKAREEALKRAEEEQKAYAEALNEPWQNAFENVQDALADMLVEGRYSFESLADIAKRLAAEVTAAWVIRPVLGEFISSGSGAGSLTGSASLSSGGSQLSNLMSLGGSLFGGTGGGVVSTFDDIASRIFGTASSSAVGPFLPGRGTASSMLGSTFGGSYGGVIANLLGLGSGNMIQDAATSLAGAALGNLLFPGVGGILGSFGATAIGGMFGPSRPHPAATVGLQGFTASGGLLGTDLQAKHMSTEDARKFAQALGTVTGAMSSIAGIDFSKFTAPEGGTAFQAGVNDGQGFFTFGNHKSDLNNKRVSVKFDPSDEADLQRALGDLAKLFVTRAHDIGQEIDDTLLSVMDNIATEGRTLEEVISDIAFASAYDTLGQFPQQLSEVAVAVNELRDQFNKAAETSERLGLAVEKVRQYEQVRMQQLLGGYVRGISQSILQATNPALLQEMVEKARFAEQMRDLELLGATRQQIQQAELLHAVNMAAIQEQNNEAQNNALEAERERYDVANNTARRFSQIQSTFESIIHDLTLGQYSPLTPRDNLDAFRAEINSLGARAQMGDIDAAEELAKLLPEFVELSGQVNGFNASFEEDRKIAESLARSTLSTAERQVALQTAIATAAQEQIDVLQAGFMSLEEALAKFGNGLTVSDITSGAEGLSGLTDGQAWATRWGRDKGYLGYNETATGGLLAGRLDASGADAWAQYDSDKKAAGFASGGLVRGIGGYDSIAARLTDGEFVMRRSAVHNIGAANLAAMNNGGGTITDVVKAIGKLSQISAASGQATAEQLSAMRASLDGLERNARLVAAS